MPVTKCWLFRIHLALLAWIFPELRKRLSLARLLALFTPRSNDRRHTHLTEQEIVRAVDRQLRGAWRMRGRPCLRRGLLLFHFLRKAGVPALLNFGVYHASNPRDQAHCWVTVDGRCAADPPLQPHVVILVHGAPLPHEDDRRQSAA